MPSVEVMKDNNIGMTESDMDEIFIRASELRLIDDENNFNLRLNPKLIIQLGHNTLRLGPNGYQYDTCYAAIIPDSTVGTYKIEPKQYDI